MNSDVHRPRIVTEDAAISSRLDRFRGCLLAGAVGDALGAPLEFMSLREIRDAYGDTIDVRDLAPAGFAVG